MWISKKKFETLWQENDTLQRQIDQQIYDKKMLKQVIYAYRRGKCRAVMNFHSVREHNTELQDRIDYLERYTKGLEDLL